MVVDNGPFYAKHSRQRIPTLTCTYVIGQASAACAKSSPAPDPTRSSPRPRRKTSRSYAHSDQVSTRRSPQEVVFFFPLAPRQQSNPLLLLICGLLTKTLHSHGPGVSHHDGSNQLRRTLLLDGNVSTLTKVQSDDSGRIVWKSLVPRFPGKGGHAAWRPSSANPRF